MNLPRFDDMGISATSTNISTTNIWGPVAPQGYFENKVQSSLDSQINHAELFKQIWAPNSDPQIVS